MFYSIHSPILSIRTYSLNILVIVPTDDIDTHDTSKALLYLLTKSCLDKVTFLLLLQSV